MPELVFPFENNNGVCEKFIDNKCSVYEDRPIICSIDKMCKILRFDKIAFYKMNANICNMFIREDGLDESFLINF